MYWDGVTPDPDFVARVKAVDHMVVDLKSASAEEFSTAAEVYGYDA